jgi:hypothetical protein
MGQNFLQLLDSVNFSRNRVKRTMHKIWGSRRGQVLHSYFSMQRTWANAKVNAMRDVSFLKRDAAIGDKHTPLPSD